jgi:hypothetical protein
VFKNEDASPTLVKMIGTRAHAIWAGPIQLSHDPIMREGGISGQPYQFLFLFLILMKTGNCCPLHLIQNKPSNSK